MRVRFGVSSHLSGTSASDVFSVLEIQQDLSTWSEVDGVSYCILTCTWEHSHNRMTQYLLDRSISASAHIHRRSLNSSSLQLEGIRCWYVSTILLFYFQIFFRLHTCQQYAHSLLYMLLRKLACYIQTWGTCISYWGASRTGSKNADWQTFVFTTTAALNRILIYSGLQRTCGRGLWDRGTWRKTSVELVLERTESWG